MLAHAGDAGRDGGVVYVHAFFGVEHQNVHLAVLAVKIRVLHVAPAGQADQAGGIRLGQLKLRQAVGDLLAVDLPLLQALQLVYIRFSFL